MTQMHYHIAAPMNSFRVQYIQIHIYQIQDTYHRPLWCVHGHMLHVMPSLASKLEE